MNHFSGVVVAHLNVKGVLTPLLQFSNPPVVGSEIKYPNVNPKERVIIINSVIRIL